jgi:hypothetical protein
MNQYDFFYKLPAEDNAAMPLRAPKKYIRLAANSLLDAVELFKTIYEKEKFDITEVIEIL